MVGVGVGVALGGRVVEETGEVPLEMVGFTSRGSINKPPMPPLALGCLPSKIFLIVTLEYFCAVGCFFSIMIVNGDV